MLFQRRQYFRQQMCMGAQKLLPEILGFVAAVGLKIKRNALGMLADGLIDAFACAARKLAQILEKRIEEREAQNSVYSCTKHEQDVGVGPVHGLPAFRHGLTHLIENELKISRG